MDSLEQNNDSLFILAATNHPRDVDSALRRPGRFDRIVAVYPRDREAREFILSSHLKKKPDEDVDVAYLAAKTHLFSGADLAHLCNSAVEYFGMAIWLLARKSMTSSRMYRSSTQMDAACPAQWIIFGNERLSILW